MLIEKYKHSSTIKNNHNHHDQCPAMLNHQMKFCLPEQNIQQSQLRHGPAYSIITALGVISMLLLLLPLHCVDAVGYSYSRFIGPVTGPEHKIYVNSGKNQHRGSGAPRLDYVGKPEYEFAYGVEDADAHILHNRNEMRDGDAVKGVYSLIDPDGALRVVKYTADEKNGFQAEVIRNGISSLYGQLQHDYNRAPPLKTISYNGNNIYKPADYEHPHNPQNQMYLKGDRNVYYPPFSAHTSTPKLEQLPQINHENYYPHNHYQTPPQPPIIYHYNKHYDGDDDAEDNDDDDNDAKSNNSGSDYREDQQPQYEVHENSNIDSHEKKDDDHYDEDGNGHKSSNDINAGGHKNVKHHPDEDDEDEDYDDDNDSEELEDYDATVHHEQNSDESDEYY